MEGYAAALAKLEFEKIRARLLFHAASEPGRAVLAELAPSASLSSIREEQERVSELKRLLVEDEPLPLDGVFSVQTPLQRSGLEGAVLQPRELLQIASLLSASRTLRSFAGKRRTEYPLLWELAGELFADKVIEYNIDQAIDESEAVRATASRELQAIRRSMTEKYDQLTKRLQRILKTAAAEGFSQEEIITTREGRMVIPVKAEYKNQVPGFIHSASSSGATVFIEPAETLDFNNEIRSLQFQEQREIQRILRSLTAQVAGVRDALLDSLRLIARIDALHARARYSVEILGREPELGETGPLRLVAARHPILLMRHGYAATVPLDLELGGAYHTLLISGPNAGGKSVAMKTAGLLVLMAQAGLHIPAGEGSRIRIFRSVLVEIGDDQSIENDLSTFSSHLRNLRAIAGEAGDGALVLIDEIGAGTDPSEGGAIAAAMLEHLTERKACTIATTHQGVLKAFAYETPGVENGAMEFDQGTLTPTYRFHAGVPGSSYALEMASRLGFSADLLDRARRMLGVQQSRLDGLIAELEASAQNSARQMEEMRAGKARVDALIGQYEGKIRAQAAELKEVKRRALEEAQQILAGANALIERSVREIRETGADKGAVRNLRGEVERLRTEVEQGKASMATEAVVPEETPIAPGMNVQLRGGTDQGEILSVSADGAQALVVFGIVKMKVPVRDLVPARGPARPRPAPGGTTPDLQRKVEREIDVRGMTGEEAFPLIDKFLDDAVLAGLHRVDVIHGKGTGALRKRVTEFLSHHPRVKSTRIAEWNEGGMGATVVELGDA